MKDLSRSVTLFCPTCGNDQFEIVDNNVVDLKEADGSVKIKCSDCGLIITKDELLDENRGVIDENINDIKQEAIKEIEKDFKKVFKKWR